MPFKSKAQERAAFGGYLGPEMKARAATWAAQTNQKALPERVKKPSTGSSQHRPIHNLGEYAHKPKRSR